MKYNIVKSEVEKYLKNQNNVNIPLYTNLACYLESISEVDLMKFNIFSIALFSKAEVYINLFRSIVANFWKINTF